MAVSPFFFGCAFPASEEKQSHRAIDPYTVGTQPHMVLESCLHVYKYTEGHTGAANRKDEHQFI